MGDINLAELSPAQRLWFTAWSHLCAQPSRNTQLQSSVRNTGELAGLLLAPGERREAHEAGEANRGGPLSPGLTPVPGLPGWAAAAGWKKSAGSWKTGEDPPPSQPGPPVSETQGHGLMKS